MQNEGKDFEEIFSALGPSGHAARSVLKGIKAGLLPLDIATTGVLKACASGLAAAAVAMKGLREPNHFLHFVLTVGAESMSNYGLFSATRDVVDQYKTVWFLKAQKKGAKKLLDLNFSNPKKAMLRSIRNIDVA